MFSQTTVTTIGGTVNTLPKFSGSSTIVNSAITESSGNVSVNGTVTIDLQRSLLFGTTCCGVNTPMGSTIGSTSGFDSNYNSLYFNQNGTVDGDGVSGAQINTSLSSWRMTLGSGTLEWGGGDNFAIGRVAAGGNYQAPSIFFSISNAGKMKIAGGVDATGGGLKHARIGPSACTFNGSTASCTVTWPGTAFADANYTAVCSPEGSVATVTVSGKLGGSMGVFVSGTGTLTGVDCIAMHD